MENAHLKASGGQEAKTTKPDKHMNQIEQMQKEDELIRRLNSLRETGKFPSQEYRQYHQPINPPVIPDDLIFAEKMLGFVLPSFLKRVYLEVGNGGFGPGYGLAPLFTPTLFPEEESGVITWSNGGRLMKKATSVKDSE
jgi:hypothetical protein